MDKETKEKIRNEVTGDPKKSRKKVVADMQPDTPVLDDRLLDKQPMTTDAFEIDVGEEYVKGDEEDEDS